MGMEFHSLSKLSFSRPTYEDDSVTRYLAMNAYFSFFDAHIKPLFRNDTNARIDGILIALAYPQVFLIGPDSSTSNVVVDVKKADIDIAPDKYSLYRFLHEHPETCKKIIHGHEGLKQCFMDWFSQQ